MKTLLIVTLIIVLYFINNLSGKVIKRQLQTRAPKIENEITNISRDIDIMKKEITAMENESKIATHDVNAWLALQNGYFVVYSALKKYFEKRGNSVQSNNNNSTNINDSDFNSNNNNININVYYNKHHKNRSKKDIIIKN